MPKIWTKAAGTSVKAADLTLGFHEHGDASAFFSKRDELLLHLAVALLIRDRADLLCPIY